MPRHPARLAMSLAIAMAVSLAACSAAATPAPTPAPTPTRAAGAPSGSPSATLLPGTKKLTVAFASVGLSSVAMMQAVDDLKAAGYQIDTPILASNLIIEGVVNGQFQASSGATLSALVAAQKGAAIKTVGNRVGNEWTITSRIDIAKCADLAGKIWANGGEAAIATTMGRNWIKQNCPGTVATEVNLAGSDKRAAAVVIGQADAAAVELSDAISTTSGANASKVRVLVSFSKELPNLTPSTIFVNGEWAAKNPGDAVGLLKATIAQNRKINADPTGAYLKSLGQRWVPSAINAATIDNVAKAYVDLKLFPSDGGFTAANLEYTIKFFTDAGSLQPGLAATVAGDLTYLARALQELGG